MLPTKKNIWFIIAIACILIGITLMIIGLILQLWLNIPRTNIIAIVGIALVMSSIIFSTLGSKKKRQEEQRIREQYYTEKLLKEQEDKKAQEQVRAEKNLQKQKSIAYLDEHKEVLIKKYATAVKNFIKKLESIGYNPFIDVITDILHNTKSPQSNILIFPYRNSTSELLKAKIKSDGLSFIESPNIIMNKEIQELSDFLIRNIKKRIKETCEWSDEFTLPALLYLIIRNNVIKYYHDKYLGELGFNNLDEFCANVPATIKNVMCFTYYYIYENNIDLPFFDTYHNVCMDIKSILAKKQEMNLENDLFGTPKKQTISTARHKPNNLSTIEKVDIMTGAEFELFMAQYFTKQGFKTTHTPLSGDYGIDLIIENDFGKIGVQAKCYSNKVSLDAVQQVVAGLRHYGLSSGLVITNNYFQPSAIRLAKDNNIVLWDRNKLIEKLGE